MEIQLIMELLRTWLYKERLVLCKESDTSFPLDGLRETMVLYNVVSLVRDAEQWEDLTDPMGSQQLERLRELSAGN